MLKQINRKKSTKTWSKQVKKCFSLFEYDFVLISNNCNSHKSITFQWWLPVLYDRAFLFRLLIVLIKLLATLTINKSTQNVLNWWLHLNLSPETLCLAAFTGESLSLLYLFHTYFRPLSLSFTSIAHTCKTHTLIHITQSSSLSLTHAHTLSPSLVYKDTYILFHT